MAVDMSAALAEIKIGGAIAVPAGKAKPDMAKAAALTQHAINNLGGPIYASMTDTKPKDAALEKAKMDMAIQKKGISSVSAAPADRAINEALTLRAITSGKELKRTGSNLAEGLSAEQLAQLQADSAAEKERKDAARTFGGGDTKAGMVNILSEIQGQGGVIAVPTEKAPKGNISLSHTKTMMEINALKGEPIYASGTDCTVTDKALEAAKVSYMLSSGGAISADAAKVAALESKGANEAKNQMALSAGLSTLKKVKKPSEGLSKEQLAALQAEAKAAK